MSISYTIQSILNLAVHAPSGDNLQPWRFGVQDNRIFIYNNPERDITLYNFRQHAAFIANGALIENIAIASPHFGYEAKIQLFPDSSNRNLVAIAELIQSSPQDNSLYEYIEKRSTNRKSYKDIALTAIQRTEIINSANDFDGTEVRLVEDKSQMKLLAKATSQGDRLIFENRVIHDFLFSHIRWTEKEELEKKNGLYLKTMELAPPQVAAFKIFKHWPIMRIFNAIGFPKLAVKGNEKLYSHGSAIGIILIKNGEDKNFVNTGRIFQRIWLTATKYGLGLHPLTAIPFFIQRIFANETKELKPDHIKLIKNSYEIIKNTFRVENDIIAIMFRIGDGGQPSAHSSRLPPEIFNQ